MWEFIKNVPDKESFKILSNELTKYAKKAIPARYSGPDWFSAGFWRGVAWSKHSKRMETIKKMPDILDRLSKIFEAKPENSFEQVNLLIEQQNVIEQLRQITFGET